MKVLLIDVTFLNERILVQKVLRAGHIKWGTVSLFNITAKSLAITGSCGDMSKTTVKTKTQDPIDIASV